MSLSYKDAGVDISGANERIDALKEKIRKTHTPNVLSPIGGFASMVALDKQYKEPVLISGTDGVGTKLMLATEMGIHKTIGIDLVAMCVNDVITTGAKPLFFLDYLGTGKLSSIEYADILEGMIEGCKRARCSLVGGETAELPGMYPQGEYDLAGFCVGVAERSEILDGSAIEEKDIIISIGSSGFHSNGYSLVRAIIKKARLNLKENYGFEKPLGEMLLEPTHLYTDIILSLKEKSLIKGAANITGGGLVENSVRILPEGKAFRFNKNDLPEAKLFRFMAEKGEVDEEECYRAFNMGIGMVVVVKSDNAHESIRLIESHNFEAKIIGEVIKGNKDGVIA